MVREVTEDAINIRECDIISMLTRAHCPSSGSEMKSQAEALLNMHNCTGAPQTEILHNYKVKSNCNGVK